MPPPRPAATAAAAAGAVDAVKIYGRGEGQVVALDNVTVTFEQSRYTAIMGPSGSGKSTLMHCLAGLDTLTSGAIFIGDTYLAKLNDKELTELRRKSVGFVFQAYNLIPTLTAEENITLPLMLGGEPKRPAVVQRGRPDRRARRSAEAPAERAVRRSAAARRRRPRPQRPTRHRVRRRTDRQPRLARPAPRSSTSCAVRYASTARRS